MVIDPSAFVGGFGRRDRRGGRKSSVPPNVVHELDPGDSIEVDEPVPCVFADTSDAECRHAVVLARVERP
ncbi:hypothetical protein ACFTY7_44700 [Streptomyces sp. NPDC057062]|uniref:hypothetical protein n=1 Tax=unclassified Streptomyces TaxID=2593676 RepID=UPI001C6E1129|nr:hypothetical protein [Streptomyces sp. MBT84]